MKSNELRIGNYVYLKSKSKEYEILSGQEIDTGTDSEDFEPISLTEEWLLKFGFEKNAGYGTYDKNKISLYFGEIMLSDKKGRTYFNSWAILEHSPKYVHELQNLYFALTGEELEVSKG